VTRNNDRVNKNPDYYRQRQQIIEHQFGTLKRHWHFDYTLTRGKDKVMGEVYLIFTCYNLKRIMSIFGFSLLMSMIKAKLSSFFVNLASFIANLNDFKPFEDILISNYTKTKYKPEYSII